MDFIQDYFVCEACQNKDFKRIYNFSMRFHGVNFSDELIYDQLTEEIYQCTNCSRTFTREEIEAGLAAFKKKRKMAN
jgi:hypothetical protein